MISFRSLRSHLTAEEKRQILIATGLDQLQYTFIEEMGSLILRKFQAKGLKQSSQLDSSPVAEGGLFRLAHIPLKSNITECVAQRGLAEVLFPFPFALLEKTLHTPSNFRFEVVPLELRNKIVTLVEALKQLEEAFQKTEISLLQIDGFQTNIPVLFQYVRKKRIKTATNSELSSFVNKEKERLRDPDFLFETFGTSVGYFYLNLRNGMYEDPVLNLANAIHESLKSSTTGILPSLLAQGEAIRLTD